MPTRKDFIRSDQQVVSCPPIFAKGVTTKLTVRCQTCGHLIGISLQAYWKRRQHGPWSCHDCLKPELARRAAANPLYKDEAYRKRFADLHLDGDYASKVHNAEVSSKISETLTRTWEANREEMSAGRQTEEARRHFSEHFKSLWQRHEYRTKQRAAKADPEYLAQASERSKLLWRDPVYRAAVTAILDKARPKSAPKRQVSSLQLLLYAALDDMGLTYYKEGPDTVVGPIVTSSSRFEGYSFDCLVEHGGRKLYIECNGEYWHRPERSPRDQAKATFLARYCQDSELLVIWEIDFRSKQRIRTLIERKLNLRPVETASFALSDVLVGKQDVTTDLKCLLANYHYLANIGRNGSIRYGASIDSKLIAAAVFSSPTRLQSKDRLGLKGGQLLELTRFCIHPEYQVKNFASWFLGRSMRMLLDDQPKIQCLLTFADTTYDHQGTIYKATNWTADGIVKPDYWYVGDDCCWYHKKSIWDLASKLGQSEAEYARGNNLHKVAGREKIRFIKWRQ